MMRQFLKNIKKEKIFIVLMALIFISIAFIIPYDNAPDEHARFIIAKFIYNHNQLPIATNSEVQIPFWGFSYATSPFLSYLISAIAMKAISIFSDSFSVLVYAARSINVIFSLITITFVIRIANKLFKSNERWIFISLCSCLPCFIFVGCYVNNDALAVMSTSVIIYAWILGKESYWDKRSCIYLAIGLSICMQSYKNAYGYLLVTILIYFYELYAAKKDGRLSDMLKKGFFIILFVIVFGGWSYFRNYMLYDGDFLGSSVDYWLGETNAIDSLKPSLRITPQNSGYSLSYMLYEMNWIRSSYRSFIGVFGYMEIELPEIYYTIYSTIFISGVFGLSLYIFKLKRMSFKNFLFYFALVLSAIIPLILSVIYSYSEGFQPQGRYCLPMLIPLMFFISKGILSVLDKVDLKIRMVICNSFVIIMICSCFYMVINVFAATYL